jgi:hypothetical protein
MSSRRNSTSLSLEPVDCIGYVGFQSESFTLAGSGLSISLLCSRQGRVAFLEVPTRKAKKTMSCHQEGSCQQIIHTCSL